MSSAFRLAILECEAPPAAVLEKYGTYGDIVTNLLTSAFETVSLPALEVVKWNIVSAESFPDLDTVDGILLTGSQYTAFDDDVWVPSLMEYIRSAYNARKPLVGFCYGHQIISRALGGTVAQNPAGWELAVEKVQLSYLGAKLFGRRHLNIQQVHRDAVVEAPPNVEVIGRSARCGVQISYQPGRILSFQGHPEFNEFIVTEEINERLEQGKFDNDFYKEAMTRVKLEHDGKLLATALWEHFLSAAQDAAMARASRL
ncbi:hypothetical protein G7Z17_g3759 [Cylindrodendrum hubeiense]|uniref:Glutamine amidotransferase domain-containing protein n=1 Tax=Cylindrodendrum hubeiense TaxID=595255 RepID=A0A9P5LHT8_9HYPO|nr:hypothetical protein G7Z17_g3759 [Cylindrodendrum hubeiense]